MCSPGDIVSFSSNHITDQKLAPKSVVMDKSFKLRNEALVRQTRALSACGDVFSNDLRIGVLDFSLTNTAKLHGQGAFCDKS